MAALSDQRSAGTTVLFFGCDRGIHGAREAGHYLYVVEGGRLKSARRAGRDMLPWAHGNYDGLDGTLAPRGSRSSAVFAIDDPRRARYVQERPQGAAAVHYRDGWTALAFWDRTGDSRGGSNSVLLFDAELSGDEALERGREALPALFERLARAGVEVVPDVVGALGKERPQ